MPVPADMHNSPDMHNYRVPSIKVLFYYLKTLYATLTSFSVPLVIYCASTEMWYTSNLHVGTVHMSTQDALVVFEYLDIEGVITPVRWHGMPVRWHGYSW
jgi:hypothetical protein